MIFIFDLRLCIYSQTFHTEPILLLFFFFPVVLFLYSEDKVQVPEGLRLPVSGCGPALGTEPHGRPWVRGFGGPDGAGGAVWGRGAVLTWAWAASRWVSTKRASRASSREQGRSSRQRYLRSRFTDWSVSTEHPAGAGEGGVTCSSRLVFLSSPLACIRAALCPLFSQMRG